MTIQIHKLTSLYNGPELATTGEVIQLTILTLSFLKSSDYKNLSLGIEDDQMIDCIYIEGR